MDTLTPEQVELRDAVISDIVDNGACGINRSWFATATRPDGSTFRVFMKDNTGCGDNQAEVIAYRAWLALDKLGEYVHVPPSIVRTVQFPDDGSCMRPRNLADTGRHSVCVMVAIDDAITASEAEQAYGVTIQGDARRMLSHFDNVIRNCDRHRKNYMYVKATDTWWAIDNGAGLENMDDDTIAKFLTSLSTGSTPEYTRYDESSTRIPCECDTGYASECTGGACLQCVCDTGRESVCTGGHCVDACGTDCAARTHAVERGDMVQCHTEHGRAYETHVIPSGACRTCSRCARFAVHAWTRLPHCRHSEELRARRAREMKDAMNDWNLMHAELRVRR